MEKKDNATKFVEELADKLGYKLVKKETNKVEDYVPEDAEKYEGMGSKSLMTEIKMIEQDMVKYDVKNNAIKQAVDNFMKKQASNEVTRTVFDGSRFLSHKLKVYNESQNNLKRLKDYLTNKLKQVSESELVSKFEAFNPDLVGEISDITVAKTPMGFELAVTVKPELTEKEKTKEIEVEE